MTTLAGDPRTVARAKNDWQRFMPERTMYGDVWDWHTLEGPFVVKRDGRYYCFYSGGRWNTDNYGVDYCVADHPLGPWEDTSDSGGPRALKTVPDHVLGPGHNSIVKGPDNVTDFMVYHAWDPLRSVRRMCMIVCSGRRRARAATVPPGRRRPSPAGSRRRTGCNANDLCCNRRIRGRRRRAATDVTAGKSARGGDRP